MDSKIPNGLYASSSVIDAAAANYAQILTAPFIALGATSCACALRANVCPNKFQTLAYGQCNS